MVLTHSHEELLNVLLLVQLPLSTEIHLHLGVTRKYRESLGAVLIERLGVVELACKALGTYPKAWLPMITPGWHLLSSRLLTAGRAKASAYPARNYGYVPFHRQFFLNVFFQSSSKNVKEKRISKNKQFKLQFDFMMQQLSALHLPNTH